MVHCADWVGTYGLIARYSKNKYECRIWRCNHKYQHRKTSCATPHVTDADAQQSLVNSIAERIKTNTGVRKALAIPEGDRV